METQPFQEKFYKENSFIKNILFSENQILASDEDYEDQENFLDHLNNNKKGKLDTHIKLQYNQIFKIILFDESNGIQIFFKTEGREDKTYMEFGDKTDYNEIIALLEQKCKNLKPLKELTGSKLVLIKPLLYTFVAICISTALIFSAYQIEQGEKLRATGSKRGLKQILISVSETLGVWGSLALGMAIIGGFIFYTIKTYKENKRERIVYK